MHCKGETHKEHVAYMAEALYEAMTAENRAAMSGITRYGTDNTVYMAYLDYSGKCYKVEAVNPIIEPGKTETDSGNLL